MIQQYLSTQYHVPFYYDTVTRRSTWVAPDQFGGVRRQGDANAAELAGIRRFHNWIKAVAIEVAAAAAASRELAVVDFPCGRGGDLLKWKQCDVRRYIGADGSAEQLDIAQRRLADSGSLAGVHARFVQTRCERGDELARTVGGADVFASMFGPHFMFASEQQRAEFLSFVSGTGARVFVCMFADADAIRSARRGGSTTISRKLFTVRQAGPDSVAFAIEGSTPSTPEPLLSKGALKQALASVGYGHVVLEGTPRQLRAQYDGRRSMRSAMGCPEVLTAAQWELADMQYVIVLERR